MNISYHSTSEALYDDLFELSLILDIRDAISDQSIPPHDCDPNSNIEINVIDSVPAIINQRIPVEYLHALETSYLSYQHMRSITLSLFCLSIPIFQHIELDYQLHSH
jgi:hypothetical protein